MSGENLKVAFNSSYNQIYNFNVFKDLHVEYDSMLYTVM
jgi:hypothetical protein